MFPGSSRPTTSWGTLAAKGLRSLPGSRSAHFTLAIAVAYSFGDRVGHYCGSYFVARSGTNALAIDVETDQSSSWCCTATWQGSHLARGKAERAPASAARPVQNMLLN